MSTRSPLRSNLSSLLPAVAACLLVAPALALAQSADVESSDAAQTAKTATVQSPAAMALDAARRAGDEKAVRRLEAEQPRGPSHPDAESAGATTLRPTTTVGSAGTPHQDPVVGGGDNSLAVDDPFFGGDVFVRAANTETGEFHHTMASDSNGNLYVAWQDDYFTKDYIQVYASFDGGESWSPFGNVMNSGADLREPSIAVGEGGNGDTVLIAYIMDDGSGLPVPEVATTSITSGVFTPHSVPIWNWWEGYAKPVIVTDSMNWSTWYAYLTCEGIYDSSANNVNVCSWRSLDGGSLWQDELVPFGDADVYPWVDPDISYGTAGMDQFLVVYREDDYTLYSMMSTTNATTWDPQVPIATLSLLPGAPVDPEIAAAIGVDNVMVCFTASGGVGGGEDNVYYSYSQNAATTWGPRYILPTYVAEDEFAVSLTANEGGGSWHLAYTSGQEHSVRYCDRPQDLTALWSNTPVILDDQGMAGSWNDRAIKGIASDWTTDEACIAWADSRDNTPGDTDTYADHVGNLGLMIDQRMVSSTAAQSVGFTLNAGPANAGRMHFLVCTMSGYDPGFPLPGGYVTLPINPDAITLYPLLFGPPMFSGFVGPLDGEGKATATLNIPANSGLVPGQILHFAFALWKPWDFASNPVAVTVSLF